MIERDIIVDMRQILSAQRAILNDAENAVTLLESDFDNIGGQASEIDELSSILSEIEDNEALLGADDFKGLSKEDKKIAQFYEQSKKGYQNDIKSLHFSNWTQFVRDSQAYCLAEDLSVLPWEAMLNDADVARLKAESYEAQYQWDNWDYVIVGSAGVLAFLTDVFLVAIPKTMTSGVYKGQRGSVVTEKLRSIKFPENVQAWLEMKAKVPYDHTGGGDHRIDSFGHDPVLGFIFGVLDIMRGGATTIKNGNIAFEAGLAPAVLNPITALVTQFLHLLSDVTTSKGLPVPFASILRALKIGSFPGPTGKTRTISQMVLWMYHHGYDLRHFVTMGITPATIEIILRAWLMIRHYEKYGETKFLIADNPKYRSMLLSAHAVACAGNAGKIAIMQGNPLAINYAEWMALIRYLIPSIKYWVFDRNKLKLEHICRINNQGWNDLCDSSSELLNRIYSETAPVFRLGM